MERSSSKINPPGIRPNPKNENERKISALQDQIKSLNDDIARTRTELFSFLVALSFIAITTFGISDKALLIGSRATLPLLNVSVSLDGFLIGSPFLVLAIHFALLLKFDKLRSKCKVIRSELNKLSGKHSFGAARNLSLQISANFLTEWLTSIDQPLFPRALNALIYIAAIILAPIVVLLFLATRTLPLHQESLTLLQNAVIIGDVWLVTYFHVSSSRPMVWSSTTAALVGTVTNLVLSVPDGHFDRIGAWLWPASVPVIREPSVPERQAFLPTAYLLEYGLDEATRHPVGLGFSRNLVVSDDHTLASQARGVGPQAEFGGDKGAAGDKDSGATISLRGRNLRYAILDRSDLHGVDFSLADLTGASLQYSDLRGAKFACAERHERRLEWFQGWFNPVPASDVRHDDPICTLFSDARLNGADLRHADFRGFGTPSLDFSHLVGARLDGVDLSDMSMQGANLSQASMIGANLRRSSLSGALLSGANLTAAQLVAADLSFALLDDARIDAANLERATLAATELSRSSLAYVNLETTYLVGARLRSALLWGSVPPAAHENLAWADLSDVRLDPPSREDIATITLSLKVIDEVGLVWPPEATRLKNESQSHDLGKQEDSSWKELKRRLSRSTEDLAYRHAISEIFRDMGCNLAQYSIAIDRLSREDWSYDVYPDQQIMLPPPPRDPAIGEITEKKGGSYPDWISYQLYPMPDWIDLGPLDDALASGKCEALKDLPPTFVTDFHSLVLEREQRFKKQAPKSD